VTTALDEADAWNPAEAEHADAQPDDPETGESGGDERATAQASRTTVVVGDEDGPLERLVGDRLCFEYCQKNLPTRGCPRTGPE
jgi:hypothetical protein